jgi:hypothetical protein
MCLSSIPILNEASSLKCSVDKSIKHVQGNRRLTPWCHVSWKDSISPTQLVFDNLILLMSKLKLLCNKYIKYVKGADC